MWPGPGPGNEVSEAPAEAQAPLVRSGEEPAMSDHSPAAPARVAGRRPETRAVLAGRRHDADSLAPVLWASTAFRPESVADARAKATAARPTRFYTRYGNPTVASFEDAVAELEGAEAARAFASGMGALTGVVLALCSQGSHVVATRQLYGGTRQLLDGVCPRFGIDVTLVDGTRPGAVAAAVQPGRTVLVLAETPANPRLDLVDLDELGAIDGPFTVVDSTFATPLGQQPLAHGVDLVVHSATKAIAGANDATLGVVAGPAELIDWIAGFAALQGATASPHDALAGLRGLRTLAARLRVQTETAHAVAAFCQDHPAVAEVRYPGLASHPQHDLAARQLRLAGGLVAFDLAGGYEAGVALVESLRVVQHAPSLGGPETLLCHPASTTHAGLGPDQLAEALISPGTVRVSCGLEAAADVIDDLAQGLARVPAG
jgi:cystathionine beta-lyase/cystathionine gamma-synthase